MEKYNNDCKWLSVTAQLERAVSCNPEKIAVTSDDTSITYSTLLDRIDSLSQILIDSGVQPGSLVAIAMDRSIDMVVAVFAVWKTDAAFVPLDLDYPTARLALVLEDARPDAIVGNARQLSGLSAKGSVLVDYDSALVRPGTSPVSHVPVGFGGRAYVMYTSGSTGIPKGVQIPHQALSHFLDAIQERLQMRDTDTLLAVTTLSFDISVLEIVLPLVTGATVVVADKHVGSDGLRLAAALRDFDVTFLQATPVTWRLLLDAGWEGKGDLTIISGGERLTRPTAEELLTKGSKVFNVYGPTETTIWATCETVSSSSGPVPIGRALSGYETHVLDQALMPVPKGETGQLYIGGMSLATGYLNRPEETTRRFVTGPDGLRLYATGDFVRELPGHRLEFVGRNDNQVKLRGFRIELNDIETHLVGLDSVRDAVVVVHEEQAEGKKLAAYLIMHGDASVENLREQITPILPRHMIPHYFVKVETFPRTPNNKIDRNELAERTITKRPVQEKIIVMDPLEAFVGKIWARALNLNNIGLDEDFFDVGGDSIQAAMITNQAQDWLREVVWPVVIFDHPTVSKFSEYLRSNYPSAIATQLPETALGADHGSARKVDEQLLLTFKSLLKPLARRTVPNKKNPRAVFVLTPPRSGSTLLRVMMAGHPEVFAPPEIELLSFNSMQERLHAFSGRESYRLEGMIRAVMEILQCDVGKARDVLAGYERQDTPVSEFYGVLQSWLEGRVLVDKTPGNCLDIEALRRVNMYFEDPLYIHLTRHPLGMIRSFEKARLHEVFFRRTEHDFSARELGELIWVTCHENILSILDSVPEQQKLRLRFEDLTTDPRHHMISICDFMGLPYKEEMTRPQENKADKMTDGLHAVSKMMGDPNFHRHQKIDSSIAETWKKDMDESSLGSITRTIATRFGYAFKDDATEDREEFVL